MPTMWDPSTRQHFQDRVDRLAPSATPAWGTLTVAGMLAHLNDSYKMEGSTPRELIDALHTLAKGGSPMSPKIARKVIREFQTEGVDEQYLLSHRETEIVKEIENGLTYKDIATKLGISPHTVHTHIKNIYEKLHANDRQGALVAARKKGII